MPFSNSSLSVTVPSSLAHQQGATLVIGENLHSIFAPLKAPSFRPASGTVSLNYYIATTLTPLSNLSYPIMLEIPLFISSPWV